MMFTGAVGSIAWLSMFVLSGWISGVCSQTPKSVAECEAHLREVLDKSNFTEVVAKLLDTHDEPSGFVYSKLKLLHKLVSIYAIASPYVRKSIRKYLGLDPTCNNVLLCAGMDNIINGINYPELRDDFYYYSRLYHHNSTDVEGLDACATTTELDFTRDPNIVLSDINEGYKGYCPFSLPYLKTPLNKKTVFYLLNAFRMTPKLLGQMKRVWTSGYIFHDMYDDERHTSWLEIIGDWWIGKRYPQDEKPQTKCQSVRLYRSEIGGGKLCMLYFRPDFTSKMHFKTFHTKKACLHEILYDIRQYMNLTIEKHQTEKFDPLTVKGIVVPTMNMRTSIDLKQMFEKQMGPLFERNEISGIRDRRRTAYELRFGEYLTNRPENFASSTKETPDTCVYLNSPFVFALVDKKTNILLKAGVFVSP